jgi:hypothetical protein
MPPGIRPSCRLPARHDTAARSGAHTEKGRMPVGIRPFRVPAQRRASTTAFSVADGRMTFSTSSAFGR